MTQQMELVFRLGYNTRPMEGGQILASCPTLDVHSQGANEPDAVASLREAIQLFVESCLEIGTLDEVLRDAGFAPAVGGTASVAANERTLEVPVPLIAQTHAQAPTR